MLASVIAIMAAAVAAGSEGQAQTNKAEFPAAVSQPAPRPAEDPDKVICHTDEVTGSRFKQRVCHTRREWDEMSANADKTMKLINERAFGASARAAASAASKAPSSQTSMHLYSGGSASVGLWR